MIIKYGPALLTIYGLEDYEKSFRSHFRVDNPKYEKEKATACEAEGIDYHEPEFHSFLFDVEDSPPRIPTGLYWAIKDWAIIHSVEIEFKGFPSWFEIPDKVESIDPEIINGMILRDYQVEACNSILSNKRGVLEIATGGGKSEICIALTLHLGMKTLCITPDQLSMKNLYERFKKREVNVGRLGGGKKELNKDVLVAVINSLYSGVKRRDEEVLDWVQNSKVLFIDESHHGKNNSHIEVASRCNAEYRIFMSGTPYKRSETRSNPHQIHIDDSWLVGLSGKNLYYLPPRVLIKKNVLTSGIFVSFPVGGSVYKGMKWWPKVYETGVVENDDANGRICNLAVNLSKMGRFPIIGIEKLEHGRNLQRTIWKKLRVSSACSFGQGVIYLPREVADKDGMDSEPAPIYEVKKGEKKVIGTDPNFVQVSEDENVVRLLQEGIINILIGSRPYDEAQDIPFLTDFINASRGKASQRLRQKIGRILRKEKGKTGAWFWDPWDYCHFFLTNHSKARLKIAKEEHYPIITDPMFSVPLCESVPNKFGEVKVKDKEIEIGIELDIPLAGPGGNYHIRPSINVRSYLEDGDDLEKCSEILHHKATIMFMREVYKQACIAGHIGQVGFEQARNNLTDQAKKYLEEVCT